MRSGVIYLYTFPNGKVYVGQTRRDPKVRHKEHLDPQIGPTNSAFWKAYQAQGEPKYEILETHQFENVEQLIDVLNERETFFINKYKATDPAYGYNVKPSGTVGLHVEPKICRLCEAYFHMYMQDIWPIFKSMEEKIGHEDQMSEDEKELYQEYFVEKNVFYHEDGSYKDDDLIYEHWFDFAEFCLQDDIRTYAHEYVHENAAQLLDEYIDKETIYQLDLEGKIIAKFDSQQDAAQAMGVKNAANINNAVLGKQKTAYGYRWVKAIDYQPTDKTS